MLEQLKTALTQSKHIVVLTGAGISVASGIPAFRSGEDKVWDEETLFYGTYVSSRPTLLVHGLGTSTDLETSDPKAQPCSYGSCRAGGTLESKTAKILP